MSLAYIGCNIELPINDDEYSDDSFYIGRCFAGDSELQKVRNISLLTLMFTRYQVIEIEISEYMNQETCAESKVKLLELCKRMDSYLEKSYFELYSCWIGDETDKRRG